MAEHQPTIWFLRSPDARDAYEAAFSKAGFAVRFIPMLQFEPTGEEALMDRLSHAERFGGIIITSPRAAGILSRALEVVDPREADLWKARPAFAVGPKTAAVLREAGMEPVGEKSGNGSELAAYVTSNYVAELPLLFLAGDRRRKELPSALASAGVPFEELTVYRTILHDAPAPDEVPDWIAAFSPSGVASWAQNEPPPGVRYAAIGPTTAEALRTSGLEVSAVADHPSPDSLLFAVMRAERGQL